MLDFNSWMCAEGNDEKDKKKGRKSKLAAEQEKRERLRNLGNQGYTGTYNMQLINDIAEMSLKDAQKTALQALEDYASKHKKMKNYEKQKREIESAPNTTELMHVLTNNMMKAMGLGVI